jgi:hypothetical protein
MPCCLKSTAWSVGFGKISPLAFVLPAVLPDLTQSDRVMFRLFCKKNIQAALQRPGYTDDLAANRQKDFVRS